jgi:crooked neck
VKSWFQAFAFKCNLFRYRLGIEDVVVGKRRVQYEEDVRKHPSNYDTWWGCTQVESSRLKA